MTVCLAERLLRCLGRKWFGGTRQALVWDEDLDAKVVRGLRSSESGGTMRCGKDMRIERLGGDVRLIACLRDLKRKIKRMWQSLQQRVGFRRLLLLS